MLLRNVRIGFLLATVVATVAGWSLADSADDPGKASSGQSQEPGGKDKGSKQTPDSNDKSSKKAKGKKKKADKAPADIKPGRPVERSSTQPYVSELGQAERARVGALVEKLLIDLDSGDPDVRAAAQLRVRNLGGDAYLPLKQVVAEERGSPEVLASLNETLLVLESRYKRLKQAQEDYAWRRDAAMEAYAACGGMGDPKLDRLARLAIDALGEVPDELRPLVPDARTLLENAIRSGCENAAIVTEYVLLLVEPYERIRPTPELRPPTDEPNRSAARLNVPPGTLARMTNAVEQVKKRPTGPYYKTLAKVAMARLNVALYGQEPVTNRYLNEATNQLPSALATPDVPDRWKMELTRALLAGKWATTKLDGERVKAVHELEKIYNTAAPKSAAPAEFTAQALTTLGRQEHDGDVVIAGDDEEASQTRLANAARHVQKAFDLKPDYPGIGSTAIEMMLLKDTDFDTLQTWYARAMQADPDDFEASLWKLWYLAPQWHGEGPDPMVSFAYEGLKTQNYFGRMSLLLAQAQLYLARYDGSNGYYKRPGVWKEILQAYAPSMAAIPESTTFQTQLAKFAVEAGQFDEARKQLDALGERADPRQFGGQAELDAFRLQTNLAAAGLARPQAETPASLGANLGAGLAKLRAAPADYEKFDSEFNNLYVVNRNEVPALTTASDVGKSVFNRLTINRYDMTIDRVRFRTPHEPRDLYWAAIWPKDTVVSWSFMSTGRTLQELSEEPQFAPDPLFVKAAVGPGDGGLHEMRMGRVLARELTPDTEYFLSFDIGNRSPTPISVAVTFVPPANRPLKYETFRHVMGLDP